MSYKEKRTIASMISGILVLTAYCIYVTSRYRSGMAALENMKFWALTILVFIGIGVVSSVIIQIIFHILLSVTMAVKDSMQNGKCNDKKIEGMLASEMVEDEMDKLIGLRAMKFGFVIAGMGFIAALISVVLNCPVAVMLNILFVSFSAGALAEGLIQLYFYRKGITNG